MLFIFSSIAVTLVWCLSLLWQLISLLMIFENRRFVKSRMRNIDEPARYVLPNIELVVPCKGFEVDLQHNLQAFVDQVYQPFCANFVVEDSNDPAVEIIQKVRARSQTKTRLHIAGISTTGGQKVHNLRHVTGLLHPATEIIVFADSDIRPDPDWISRIMRSIKFRPTDCITGYRWMIPRKNSLTNLVVCSANSAVASTFGSGSHFLIWGGAWSIRRDVFDSLEIRDAWKGALSDDLVATQVLKRNRIPVMFEPASLSASTVDFNIREAFEFSRRQLLITRKHFPHLWLASFATCLLINVSFWSALLVGIIGIVEHQTIWSFGMFTAISLLGLHAIKAKIRQRLCSFRFPQLKKQLRTAAQFDMLAFPLVAAFSLCSYASSMIGNTLVWRGNKYLFANPSRSNSNDADETIQIIYNTGKDAIAKRDCQDNRYPASDTKRKAA